MSCGSIARNSSNAAAFVNTVEFAVCVVVVSPRVAVAVGETEAATGPGSAATGPGSAPSAFA